MKRLWRQVIQAKIEAQADLLEQLGRVEALALRAYVQRVRSGDPDNIEAQAARRYWPALFGESFRRDRHGAAPNGLLNYGYMVVRAALTRALCGAGLHPSLGIHHCNKYNPYALADDLFEPLRPIVDRVVHGLVARGKSDVEPDTKRVLLGLLADESAFYGLGRGPLLIAMERYASSLAQCFMRERDKLEIPESSTRAPEASSVPESLFEPELENSKP